MYSLGNIVDNIIKTEWLTDGNCTYGEHKINK